ncbi:MAG: DUF1987 domain-containing protein [Bacteroidales bacterium]|jgi:hypothetical protein|nr:DUF1987 domain-containing protein [Bacteroidales bacterium]
MEKHIIQKQSVTYPEVVYNMASGALEITGKSIPENPESLFTRIMGWIDSHLWQNNTLRVLIFLEYLNSGSSKYLLDVFKQLARHIDSGKDVDIKWQYEADDISMLELGEHYRDTVGIPIKTEMIL